MRSPVRSRRSADEGIIQHNPRHGGEAKARAFYESDVTKAFEEAGVHSQTTESSCVMFAHKTTAAWETLLTSLLAAGLVVTASWPVDTEMGARTGAARGCVIGFFGVHRVPEAEDARRGIH